ncbi:MAG: hypothetical protein RL226_56 [Bacteroidota bacterium]
MPHKVIVSDRALNSFRRLLESVKSTSLVGAEDARTTVVNRLRKLTVNATGQSRKANFETLDGEYRSVLAWNYRIYYKVEEKRIIVLDMIIDAEK